MEMEGTQIPSSKIMEFRNRFSINSHSDMYKRTCGIHETSWKCCDGLEVKLCDVGGYRYERAKWSHCMMHASCIIYLVSLPALSHYLYESQTVLELTETKTLIKELLLSRFLENAGFGIVFSGKDLFSDSDKEELRSLMKVGNEKEIILQILDYFLFDFDAMKKIPYIVCNLKSKDDVASVKQGLPFLNAWKVYRTRMAWTEEKHKDFPLDFREAVKILLMYFKRLKIPREIQKMIIVEFAKIIFD